MHGLNPLERDSLNDEAVLVHPCRVLPAPDLGDKGLVGRIFGGSSKVADHPLPVRVAGVSGLVLRVEGMAWAAVPRWARM